MGTHRSSHRNQVSTLIRPNIHYWSQTDFPAVLVSFCPAGTASQTLALAGADGEVDFLGSGVVSHTVELGGEDGMGGLSFVGVDI